MSQEAINRAMRTAKRKRMLGTDRECTVCGWAEPLALTKTHADVRCYECRCTEHGRPTIEEHHIMGKDNDPTTVPVPGNLHRWLNDRQQDWPDELRNNPDRDPLVWIAQMGGGLSDHLFSCAKILAVGARWLLTVAGALRREHGVDWCAALGIPSFWEMLATA